MQVDDLKCSIKFQLKKVLCMGVAVAHVAMSERDIYVNTQVCALSGHACEMASVSVALSAVLHAAL